MNDNIKILNEGTQVQRGIYVRQVQEARMGQLNALRKELEAAGMDAEKVAPYPHGNMSRRDYRTAEAKFYRVSHYFQSVKGSRSHREPNIVVERPDAESKVRASAAAEANACFDAYIAKLNVKIGAPIRSAKLSGGLWDWSRLYVWTTAGLGQCWETKCILNCSCLGKLFNQWPTRRIQFDPTLYPQ